LTPVVAIGAILAAAGGPSHEYGLGKRVAEKHAPR
jgi:hypothetical protein